MLFLLLRLLVVVGGSGEGDPCSAESSWALWVGWLVCCEVVVGERGDGLVCIYIHREGHIPAHAHICIQIHVYTHIHIYIHLYLYTPGKRLDGGLQLLNAVEPLEHGPLDRVPPHFGVGVHGRLQDAVEAVRLFRVWDGVVDVYISYIV